jgi:hypothetical protein
VLERVIRRSQIFVLPPTDMGSSIYYIYQYNIYIKWFMSRSVLFCSVLFCPVLSSTGGLTAEPIELKIGTNTHWNYAMKIGGRRSRVCIDARTARANVRAAPHIQHRRPNGWTGRAQNWYKHSLEQWADVMGVGGRECALM